MREADMGIKRPRKSGNKSARFAPSRPGPISQKAQVKASSALRRPAPVVVQGISTIIEASRRAFRRDLPNLLKKHYFKWVAYSGDRRIGIGTSKTELCQECLRQGLKRGEFLVESIEPELPRATDASLNV
jgi:hypothetical protein